MSLFDIISFIILLLFYAFVIGFVLHGTIIYFQEGWRYFSL